MTQFYGKTKICYGKDALETLEGLPSKRALLVTDPFMIKAGFADQVKTHLDRNGTALSVFDSVEPDPSLETVTKATLRFLSEGADTVIALGGGSAIDAAKAVVFFAYKAGESPVKPPLIAIPTTSGTGSEVTAVSVVTDKVNKVKIPLNDELLIPDIAILDARFTRTAPASVTAAAGLDVLTHAVEAFVSRQANAFTDIYAKYAVRHVFGFLERAYRRMDDMEAREMMLLGSCMAGMAFNNSGLGVAHSLSHSLGGLFHIPHGVANAVLLPHVIRFNGFAVGVRYRELGEILSLPATSVEEGTASFIQAVDDLRTALGIPRTLRSLKIEERAFREHLDVMAQHALNDFCSAGNPRRPSRDDLRQILERAW